MRPALYLALLPLVTLPAGAALADVDPLTGPAASSGEAAVTAPAERPPTPEAPAAAPAEQPEATTSEPAPGSASGAALEVEDVASVGETSAEAGPQGSASRGDAVTLLGEPLIEGTTGGGATSDGQSEGALVDTGETELGRAAVTPWEAQATSADGSSSSSSAAALARLQLVDLLSVDVLQSDSEAQYSPAGSRGASSSDGAVIDLGDGQLVVRVLHAETSSTDGGGSHVLGVNDTALLSDEDADGQCALAVPSLVGLSCLTAEGGAGATDSAAEVVGVTLADGQLPGASVSEAGSSGTAPSPAVSAAGPTAGDAGDGPADASTQVQAAAVPSADGTLAFTGAHTGAVSAAAALLLAAGTALVRMGRRQEV